MVAILFWYLGGGAVRSSGEAARGNVRASAAGSWCRPPSPSAGFADEPTLRVVYPSFPAHGPWALSDLGLSSRGLPLERGCRFLWTRMAAFAVNRGLQFATEVRCRALLTSWAKRECSSLRPVRNIGRRCSQNDKSQNFALSDSCEKKESSLSRSGVSNGGGRVARSARSAACRFPVQSCGDGSLYEMSSFVTDPECSFEDPTGSELDFMDCEFIDEAEQPFDKPLQTFESAPSRRDKGDFKKMKEDAEKMAINLLATRSFATVELQKKLRGKKYPSDVIESVIIELKSRGLLNDGLYAESFSQSRWISSSWGPRRIRRALLQKGVSEADIEKATHLVFKDGDMGSNTEDTYYGMSKISVDRLFAQASKQWLRGQNGSLENRRSRMVRWLQYRGFDWGVTNFILRKLESKYPP